MKHFRNFLHEMKKNDMESFKILCIASKISEDKINEFIDGKDNLNKKEINLLNLLS